MKTTIIGALAAALLAGASQAALAQEPGVVERPDREPRDQSFTQPRQVYVAPPAPPRPAEPVAPREPTRTFEPRAAAGVSPGRDARFGAPPPPPQPAAAPAASAGQHVAHDGGHDGGHDGARDRQLSGDHHFDRAGGPPAQAIPTPAAPGDRRRDDHHDDHRDGHHDDDHDGHWDRNHDHHRDGHGDGHWDRDHDDDRDGHHFDPGRWERDRFPPIFWSPYRFHIGSYRAPYGFYARSWGFGDFLPRGWYGEPYWIGDFVDYDLPYPPPGFEWVRVGDDALMIDRYTGRIVQVVRGIFW